MTDLTLNERTHAYILAAPPGSARDEAARKAAAALICECGGTRACGVCRHCVKTLTGKHPDVSTLEREADDKGRPKREIYVNQIRALAADAQVSPNEAGGKVCIINDADAMNVSAQNALLKLLEEPPGNVCFILCAVSETSLLPTVRSRCAVITLTTGTAASSDAVTKRADELIRGAAKGDKLRILRFFTDCEKMDSRELEEFLICASSMLTDILCGRLENPGLDRHASMAMIEIFEKARGMLKVNTGVKHLLGMVAAQIIDHLEMRKNS